MLHTVSTMPTCISTCIPHTHSQKVLGELAEGVTEVVPKLIDPVVAGQSDLAVSLSTETRAVSVKLVP